MTDDFSPFQHLKAEYKQCRDLLLSYPRKAAGLINLNKKHLVKLEAQNKQYTSTLKQLKHKLKTCHKHEIYVVPDNFDNESQFNRDDFILLEEDSLVSRIRARLANCRQRLSNEKKKFFAELRTVGSKIKDYIKKNKALVFRISNERKKIKYYCTN